MSRKRPRLTISTPTAANEEAAAFSDRFRHAAPNNELAAHEQPSSKLRDLHGEAYRLLQANPDKSLPDGLQRKINDCSVREDLFQHAITVSQLEQKGRRPAFFHPPDPKKFAGAASGQVTTANTTWTMRQGMPPGCRCPGRFHIRTRDPLARACRFVPDSPVTVVDGAEVGFAVCTEFEAFEAWRRAGYERLPYNASWERTHERCRLGDHTVPELGAAESLWEMQRYRRHCGERLNDGSVLHAES